MPGHNSMVVPGTNNVAQSMMLPGSCEKRYSGYANEGYKFPKYAS